MDWKISNVQKKMIFFYFLFFFNLTGIRIVKVSVKFQLDLGS